MFWVSCTAISSPEVCVTHLCMCHGCDPAPLRTVAMSHLKEWQGDQTKRCSGNPASENHLLRSVSHICACVMVVTHPLWGPWPCHTFESDKCYLVIKLSNVLRILHHRRITWGLCHTSVHVPWLWPTPSEDRGYVTPVRVTKCNLVTKLSDVLGILHPNSIYWGLFHTSMHVSWLWPTPSEDHSYVTPLRVTSATLWSN